jgi:hypothetical protein
METGNVDMRASPPKQHARALPDFRIFFLLAPLLLTAVSFLPMLSGAFTNWDDPEYVTENSLIHSLSPGNILHIFSPATMVSFNYQPLTILSLAINYAFGRLDPAGYFATNLFFHLLNVFLVFLFIRRLAKNDLVASITALLFGIHPMHVEAVAWITGRKELLYTAFYLAALLAYLSWRHASGPRRYGIYSIVFIFSLMSMLAKSSGVTLPAVFLLIDFFERRKFTLKTFIEKLPFLLPALLLGIWAIKGQLNGGSLGLGYSLPLVQRALIAGYSAMFYVVRFFIPIHLSAFYPYPDTLPGPLPLPYQLSPFFLIATGTAVYYFRRSRAFLFGFFFFLITIFFVLHFIPVGATVTTDRFTYLPYIGLSFIIACLFETWGVRRVQSRKGRILPVAGGIVIVAALSAETFAHCGVWHDSETLWSDVLRHYRNVPMAYNNRGTFYSARALDRYENGDYAGGAIYLDKALSNFNVLISADSLPPRNHYLAVCRALAYNNRGSVFTVAAMNTPGAPDADRLRQAIGDFNRAVALDPNSAQAFHNRANAYGKLGLFDSAFADYRRSLSIDSGNPATWYDRGLNENLVHRFDDAIEDFTHALSIDPTFAKACNDRGIALAQEGKFLSAEKDFEAAVALDPADRGATNNLDHARSLMSGENRPGQ